MPEKRIEHSIINGVFFTPQSEMFGIGKTNESVVYLHEILVALYPVENAGPKGGPERK